MLLFDGIRSGRFRRGGSAENTVSRYQRAFFQKITFVGILLVVRSSAALFFPFPNTNVVVRGEDLCPNPVDLAQMPIFQFYNLPIKNESYKLVVVVDEVRRGHAFSYQPPSCNFLPPITPKGQGSVALISLQQNKNILTFGKRCSEFFELKRGDSEVYKCGVAHPLNTDGLVQFIQNGLYFHFPYKDGDFLPFITALFRVTSDMGSCSLQLQQYGVVHPKDSKKCGDILKNKLLNNVCANFECREENKILSWLSNTDASSEMDNDDEGSRAKFRTVGYFLKGLLIPLLISISSALGYVVWRRRVRGARLMALRSALEGLPVSLGTQTSVMDGHHNLIQLEDDYTGEGGEMARQKPYSHDKPPSYQSILDPRPPSYEQATQLPPQEVPLLAGHGVNPPSTSLSQQVLSQTLGEDYEDKICLMDHPSFDP